MEHYFTTRHARPAREAKEGDPISPEYPDLTEQGVEQARERARNEITRLIANAPEDSVIFIGGISDQPRTRQTAEIYGDALADLQKETKDEKTIIVTKSDIDSLAAEEKVRVMENLRSLVKSNPDKKIVVDYPLALKEMMYKYHDRWTDAKGKRTEYFTEILKKHNQDHNAAGADWFANAGRLEIDGKVLQGPNPQAVAEDYFRALQRLRSFVEKNAPGRPVVVSQIGHQWDLDALVTYLANGGKVDYEGFKRVSQGQGMTQEAEMTEIILDPNNPAKSVVNYRGRRFTQESGV